MKCRSEWELIYRTGSWLLFWSVWGGTYDGIDFIWNYSNHIRKNILYYFDSIITFANSFHTLILRYTLLKQLFLLFQASSRYIIFPCRFDLQISRSVLFKMLFLALSYSLHHFKYSLPKIYICVYFYWLISLASCFWVLKLSNVYLILLFNLSFISFHFNIISQKSKH